MSGWVTVIGLVLGLVFVGGVCWVAAQIGHEEASGDTDWRDM